MSQNVRQNNPRGQSGNALDLNGNFNTGAGANSNKCKKNPYTNRNRVLRDNTNSNANANVAKRSKVSNNGNFGGAPPPDVQPSNENQRQTRSVASARGDGDPCSMPDIINAVDERLVALVGGPNRFMAGLRDPINNKAKNTLDVSLNDIRRYADGAKTHGLNNNKTLVEQGKKIDSLAEALKVEKKERTDVANWMAQQIGGIHNKLDRLLQEVGAEEEDDDDDYDDSCTGDDDDESRRQSMRSAGAVRMDI